MSPSAFRFGESWRDDSCVFFGNSGACSGLDNYRVTMTHAHPTRPGFPERVI
ncbi:hypothetical protein BDZ89DRAFT_1078957 [Hymenopellis radicata]|nr:hypothetical protein BDZ89DRAFT_1078957 [Hymenopellis radicata]